MRIGIITATILCALIGILCWGNVRGELFTALTNLKGLTMTINVVNTTLENYIRQQEDRLYLLKRYAFYISEETKRINEAPEEYLSNPINDYNLIKRLTIDWNTTKNLIFDDFHEKMRKNITMRMEDILFPSDEDLHGAAVALIRLQDTYNLNTESIAKGELNGISRSTELGCDDCFFLGKTSYDLENYYFTYSWMAQSLRKCEFEERDESAVNKWEVLDYLAYAAYLAGNGMMALSLTFESLKVHPVYKSIIKNVILHEKLLNDDRLNRTSSNIKTNNIILEMAEEEDIDIVRYKQLCSRRLEMAISVSSQLRCRYVNYGKPFLTLAPLKEEEVYLNPRIILFREVLYPSEIAELKIMALPKLERAIVYYNTNDKKGFTDRRINKCAWLMDSSNQVLQRIDKRLEDMTSLSLQSAERLQVANYGIAGHFTPHYDFLHGLHSTDNNRIATVIFYMNDVKQGGATVFPRLNLTLWPEEGSAAFWYNLQTSGAGDERTLHGACPVLEGSKWAANKWFHENGQEFLRPCDLSEI